jgi:hypothetical protein
VNEARNASIFNNSIIEFKNRPISQSCVPVALIFEFNIELLNIDVFLASFTLSYVVAFFLGRVSCGSCR